MEPNFNIIQQNGESSVRLSHDGLQARHNISHDPSINLVRQDSSAGTHLQENSQVYKKPQLNTHNDSLGLDMLLSNMNNNPNNNDMDTESNYSNNDEEQSSELDSESNNTQ